MAQPPRQIGGPSNQAPVPQKQIQPQAFRVGDVLQTLCCLNSPPHEPSIALSGRISKRRGHVADSELVPGPRCECGSASIGHPGHSTWCPVYRNSG
jgi:hypothetical protein